ncbi:T9SS type A sorting domain-containing protein [uncultured Psychroserpens sp.]|uniref:T9SS type A sorting domain-containing protein n=1 Tax=uncultured Psychroserpens sp. TaxID=255436 RepID=UPI0026360A34|nr:T9SS type A sorting domain-containing protein [uncultured Psychroserpens sp.]
MKYIRFVFIIIMSCHTLYAQDKKIELSSKTPIIEKTEVFKCHPNPVENDLFIIGTHKIKSIEIIDALGKSVASYQFNKSIIRMDVSQLESGIYFLKAVDKNDKQEIKKLIVK